MCIRDRFSGDDAVRQANRRALSAGHAFGETAELGANAVIVPASKRAPGTYRSVDGKTALAWGLIAAGGAFDDVNIGQLQRVELIDDVIEQRLRIAV